MAERQIPGGAYHNEQGTTRESQIPGAQYVNEVAAAAAVPDPTTAIDPAMVFFA